MQSSPDIREMSRMRCQMSVVDRIWGKEKFWGWKRRMMDSWTTWLLAQASIPHWQHQHQVKLG